MIILLLIFLYWIINEMFFLLNIGVVVNGCLKIFLFFYWIFWCYFIICVKLFIDNFWRESRSNLGFVMMIIFRVDEFVYLKLKEEEYNKFDNYKSFKG